MTTNQNQQRHLIDISDDRHSKFELQKSLTRLNIAQAEEIELRNQRTKRDLMSLPEVDGLLARLHSRFLGVELGGSRLAGDRVAQQLADEMGMIKSTITLWKSQA